jgi:hypothetical protein
MEYNNPFYVHKLPQSGGAELPKDEEIWKTNIINILFKNYFIKAIERGNFPCYKDYDFTNESVEAYVLPENAKTIFINSYDYDKLPNDDIFTDISEETKKKLFSYKLHKFS